MLSRSVISTVLATSAFSALISERLGPNINKSSICAHIIMSSLRKID